VPLGGPAVVARGGLALELAVGERLGTAEAAWSAAAWEDHDRAESGSGWSPDEPLAVTARRDGAVVGTATGLVRSGDAQLERLLVGAPVRGEGVGGHLLAAFTAAAAERGGRRVVLRTRAGGPAERFYRDRGFTEVARLPRWRRGEDFVVLERSISGT
jgi:GNAT superfamily N-acetyltransferase